jgi:hypothetical protein
MDWWLTQAGGVPVGPASTELVLKGIAAGKVPSNVLVCEVGGNNWKALRDIPAFSKALGHEKKSRLDPNSERTVLDAEFFPPSRPPPPLKALPVPRYDERADRTIANARQPDDEEDEKTIVDLLPPLPSEPPRS